MSQNQNIVKPEDPARRHLNGVLPPVLPPVDKLSLVDELLRDVEAGTVKPAAPVAPQQANIDQILLAQGAHDEGNAQCVNALYAGQFCQNKAMGWLRYTGTHWTQEQAEDELDRAITKTLETRCRVALDNNRADLIARSIPNASKVGAAKSQFSSLVPASANAFDVDPNMLNCKNGVVDLRTGELHAHAPDQRFTYCTAVDYIPGAPDRTWVQWLEKAVGKEYADFLQIAAGYSATGHTREEVLFYLFGPPRSGKGTFTETLLTVLGNPLAKEVNFATFTAQRTGDSQNFDLAPLKPCRFVAASESNAYERFNEAKVKALTGGNEVYCAFKHRDHFAYRPQFKIWLSTNQPVNADPDDDAVWGRLRIVEFPDSHLGREDKRLKERMKSPAVMEGVLAWVVEGARKWFALGSAGLPELESSKRIKALHRGALDNVQAWIEETCFTGGNGFCSNSLLYLSYEKWCRENGIEPKKQKGFSQSLMRKGYQEDRTTHEGKGVRGFRGIGLS